MRSKENCETNICADLSKMSQKSKRHRKQVAITQRKQEENLQLATSQKAHFTKNVKGFTVNVSITRQKKK